MCCVSGCYIYIEIGAAGVFVMVQNANFGYLVIIVWIG